MKIKKITVSGFRNLRDTEIIPHDGMNVICGDNAQGKTNLIEAIWIFTGAKSFRGSKDPEFIGFNAKSANISADFISEGIEKNAEIKIGDKKTAFLNGKQLKSVSHLAGNFYAIVFSPTDLNLVTDGPSVRRRFLDLAIGQLYPKYIDILRKYTRALQQRNNILYDCSRDASLKFLLDDYEAVIAENGEKIIKYRLDYCEKIKKYAPKIYEGIAAKTEILDIEYLSTVKEGNFAEQLKAARREDMKRNVTSVGPHRDDLCFKINSFNARLYGSQGQKRSVALSLKLSEAEIIKSVTGELPIALLDDVMSELDKNRQNYILNHIDGWQVFITCCETEQIENLKKGKVFTVKNGEIK